MSESEVLEKVPADDGKHPEPECRGVGPRTDFDSEVSYVRANVDFFQTDISDRGELMDNSGAEIPAGRPMLINPGSETPSNLESASVSKTENQEVNPTSDQATLYDSIVV